MRAFTAALGRALSGRFVPVLRVNGQQRNCTTAPRSLRADASFFDLPCEALARRLLGQVLVRRLTDGEQLRAQIVETECYPGAPDRASHACAVRRVTPRTAPLYAQPGTCAVTRVYGVNRCFSVSSRGARRCPIARGKGGPLAYQSALALRLGAGACVLLRALEPLQGCARMLAHRREDSAARGLAAHELRAHRVCSGPGKLCVAMDIDQDTFHAQPLWACSSLWVERRNAAHWAVRAPRVGVPYAGLHWAFAPLRFYLPQSSAVSVRDKAAEFVMHNVAMVAGAKPMTVSM